MFLKQIQSASLSPWLNAMDDDARIAELLAHDVEDAAIMFENWPGQTHASVCSLWPAAEMCLAERYADGARCRIQYVAAIFR